MKKIPVFVVDNQILFSDILSAFISNSIKFEIAGVFDCAEYFIQFLIDKSFSSRAICLMDISLPGMNGLAAHDFLQTNFPWIKTIFLTNYQNRTLIRRVMSNNAGSFLLKNCHIEELAETIEQVYHFDQFFSDIVLESIKWEQNNPNMVWGIIDEDRLTLNKLSKREEEILQMICLQMNSFEIAEKLFLSLRTVENHRNNLLIKTRSKNTVGLVSFAIKNDLYFPS